jgi:amino acid adenylation domain-containing protein/non-ribosomal peptide synthase protein (TIGR01720 family)
VFILKQLIKTLKEQSHMSSEKNKLSETYPLTSYQQDIWLKHTINPNNPLCNIGATVEITGRFNYKKLKSSINKAIIVNDALRIQIIEKDGNPYQVFMTELKYDLPYYDFSDKCDCKQFAKQWMQKKFLEAFAIDNVLFDFALIKVDETLYYFFTKAHHIIADGWGLTQLNHKIVNYYNNKNALNGNSEKNSFKEFIDKDKEYLSSKSYQKDIEFWKKEYTNMPESLFAYNDRREDSTKITSKRTQYLIKRSKYDKIINLCNKNNCTEFHYFLGIVSLYFCRLYNRDEIVIDVPVLNRNKKERQIIGHCTNAIPLRIKINNTSSFIELLRDIKIRLAKSYRHYKLSYGQIFRELKLKNENLADITVSFEIYDRTLNFKSAKSYSDTLSHQHEKQALNIQINPASVNEDAIIYIDYLLEIFNDKFQIKDVILHLKTITNDTLENPEKQIKDLEILTKKEKNQLLIEWNNTKIDFPSDKCLHQLFEEQVEKTPNDVALEYEQIELTYRELNEKANIVAYHLKKNINIHSGDLIGIYQNRSDKLPISILGILKAGAAYVPIDTEYPRARIDFILHDAKLKTIISEKDDGNYIDINKILNSSLPKANLNLHYNIESPIYIIYTSGSTGNPKGTVIKHESFVNYILWAKKFYYNNHNGGNYGLFTSISFDLTTTCIFLSLLRGKTLTVFNQEDELSYILTKIFQSKTIDSIKLTPSHISLLCELELDSTQIRLAIVGGEELRNDQVAILKGLNKEIKIINEYGPTEVTVGCIVKEIESSKEQITIGKPIDNTQIYIVDYNMNIQPIGVPGELCIAGEGLAKEYLYNPEITAEKFIKNPFNNEPNSRLYKTGDLVRYLPDGNIEFIGRIDNQVKIRGYRIELGEIESVLNKLPTIKDCVVVDKDDTNDDKRLVAYIVSGDELNVQEIRENLSQSLPDYMVPSIFVSLEKIPLTPNGKIDRKALPEPEGNIETTNEYLTPRNETERILTTIWAKVLGVEKVGVYDNFFELGGDSIIAIQIVSRAKQENILLTPKDIFKYQTIEKLSQLSNKNEIKIIAEQDQITGEVALTPIQSWFFEEDFENKDHWNQAVMLKVTDTVEISMLENAINALVLQHDVLRLAYTIEKGKWIQKHNDILKCELEIVDYSNLSGKELSKSIEEHSSKIQGGLSIENGILFKAAMFRTNNQNELFIAINHLVVDGVSWRIIIEDLQKACLQQISNEEIDLGLKTSSFKQWAEKLSVHVDSNKLAKEFKFWDETISKTNNSLPFDYSGENTEASAKSITVKLNKELTRQLLNEAGKAYKTEINDLLLTALAISIEKWTRNNSITINLESHGREDIFIDTDISRTVGWFTTQFPVSLTLEKENDIADTIKSIKEQLRVIPNKGIGYGILRYLHFDASVRERLSPKKNNEISFNYLGQFDTLKENSDLMSVSKQSSGVSISNANHRTYIIDINSLISDGELVISLGYSENLHKKETIEDLANTYIVELQNIIEHCLQSESKGYTPSDFPLCKITQKELDGYVLSGIEIDNLESVYPLSPMQEGMLFHALYSPESEVYMTQINLDFVGQLNSSAFNKAWQSVIDKYTILRTSFVSGSVSKPLQRVHKFVKCNVELFDFIEFEEKEIQTRLDTLSENDRTNGFDLTKAPLSKFKLIKVSENKHHFIWTHHHILLDGWCLSIVFKEFYDNYQAASNNEEIKIENIDKYEDFIYYLQEQDKSKAEEFWKSYLKGFENPTPIPIGNNNQKADETDTYKQNGITLNTEDTKLLNDFSKEHHLTINTLVQSAWSLLLSRYSGENDIVFGMTVSGRPASLPGVEERVGLFINTLPLRVKVDGNQNVIKWLQILQEQQPLLREYEYMPLVNIQSLSEVSNSENLFNSILVFENYPIGESGNTKNSSLEIENVQSFEKTNYQLTILASVGNNLAINISYNNTIYSTDIIEQTLGHFREVLLNIVKYAKKTVSDIEILTSAEKHTLLTEWNYTATDYPKDKCVHQLFEEQVKKTPDNIAVVFENTQLTYRELNEKSNQLAHYLQSKGVKQDSLVGIWVDRSLDMIVGLLGILKSGGAYVPIDPTYPKERISYMLEDSECSILLTQGVLKPVLPELDTTEIICFDEENICIEIEKESADNVVSDVQSNNLIYVIFTSGSTGRPKGTLIEHKNVISLFCNKGFQFDFSDKDVWVLFHSFCFDFSVWEMYGALLFGGKLIVVSKEIAKDTEQFYNIIENLKITVLNQTPSAFYSLSDFVNRKMPNLSVRYVIFGGEALAPSRLRFWYDNYPDCKLINMYGITETTVHVTYKEISELEINSNICNIGKPIPSLSTYILDKNKDLLPIGVPGELCVSGTGVSRGYLKNSALTTKKFHDNPFVHGEKIYLSGDSAYVNELGELIYCGRIDDQVKIRGFRIELGEIEFTLNKLEAIITSVVIAKQDKTGNKRLVAYIVPSQEKEGSTSLNIEKLREDLSKTLPDYMIPALFVKLEAVPLTPNGKIDRKALPEPEGNIETTNEYVAPRNETEQKLADIWIEVLDVEKVSINDNFFELGGHSLLATQVISKIRNEFNIELPLKIFFENTSIIEISEKIDLIDGNNKISKIKKLEKKGLLQEKDKNGTLENTNEKKERFKI